MALGDELAIRQIEVLLDMHVKKLQSEMKLLRDDLAHTREELHKAIKDTHRAQESAAQQGFSGQFGAGQAPPWAQAPQQAWSPQQAPPQAQAGWGAPAQQQWQQAAPQAPPVNKWAPPPQKAPATQPIDRNNVAPSEVTIDKFFNFSGGSRNK